MLDKIADELFKAAVRTELSRRNSRVMIRQLRHSYAQMSPSQRKKYNEDVEKAGRKRLLKQILKG